MNRPLSSHPVDLYYTVCPVPASSSIAIDRGEFARAFSGSNIVLHNIRHHADRKVREAHYDQTQPGLFREGGNIPPLWARSDGRDLRLIGLAWIDHYSSLLTLPDSGIRTPADLKGKKIGLVRRPNDKIDYARATALRGTLTALKTAGLKYGDVQFVDIDIEEPLVAARPAAHVVSASAFSVRRLRKSDGIFVRALLDKSVDAIHVTGGGSDLEALLDANVVFDVAKSLDPIDRINNLAPIAFTVRGEFLEEHPEIVSAYLAQSIRTARWAKQHPAEAIRHIGRNTGTAEESITTHYSEHVASALEPSLSGELLAYLQNQKDFLLEYGFLARDFALDDFVARDPLAAALKIVDTQDSHAARELPTIPA